MSISVINDLKALGLIVAVRSPRTPLGPISPEVFLQYIINDRCSVVMTVPNYVEVRILQNNTNSKFDNFFD